MSDWLRVTVTASTVEGALASLERTLEKIRRDELTAGPRELRRRGARFEARAELRKTWPMRKCARCGRDHYALPAAPAAAPCFSCVSSDEKQKQPELFGGNHGQRNKHREDQSARSGD